LQRELANEIAAEDAHIAGETNKIDLVGAQFSDQLAVVNLAVEPFGRQQHRPHSSIARGGESRCVGAIGNDDRNLGSKAFFRHGIGNRQEIRAAARQQNAQPLHL
jgi:hypothetical protein